MTILTHRTGSARHRVERRATRGRTDRFRDAVRTAHAPLRRAELALVGFTAGLLTAAIAVWLTLWIGA